MPPPSALLRAQLGFSALFAWALAMAGHLGAVRFLLPEAEAARGHAGHEVRDHAGHTPAGVAAIAGHAAVQEWIQAHAASRPAAGAPRRGEE